MTRAGLTPGAFYADQVGFLLAALVAVACGSVVLGGLWRRALIGQTGMVLPCCAVILGGNYCANGIAFIDVVLTGGRIGRLKNR